LKVGHDIMVSQGLAQIAKAATLCRLAQKRKGSRGRILPCLWLITDPDRLPDPMAAARALPRGSGIIYRGFGRPGSGAQALALSQLARQRGLILLIGADGDLARRVGASGVHLPERLMARAPRLRAQNPQWILTTAAHSPLALAAARRLGLNATLVSPIFSSQSPSATRPIGLNRLALWTRGAKVPVIALGGIRHDNARSLAATGVVGLAAVEGLRT
jgi:thiamine-phosphate pyrophosphorylase